jgi:formylglycine-generating enzyme required for sulfatase activity
MMQTAIDKLRELRALHDEGLLSREEFDSRKNAILDASYAAPREDPRTAPAGTEIGLMAGQEVGPFERRYRLERLIAHGGMGQVWQATDLATHAELGHSDQVALKILPPQLTRQTAHARLLIEEAARARQLAHEHIVRVYDWAQDPATASFFLIMECLDGEDLDSLLAREGRLGLERTLALLRPVAAALDYAWERHQLVHRDIKPANVFLTRSGQVKLLDFGIAARTRRSGVALEAPGNSGTAGYRAPEAGGVRGKEEARPARGLDVHAVAVMTYRMLAGRLPFGELRSEEGCETPERPEGLGEAQWEVLQAGFAASAGARPASVSELLERLAAAPASPRSTKAGAKAAAPAVLERQRIEQLQQERMARLAAEEARRVRREELRRQLAERRAQAQHELAQARAAAAYSAQQRVHAAHAGQAPAALAEPQVTVKAGPAADTLADAEGVLRDRFLDGKGQGPALVLLPAGRFQMGSPEHERKLALQAGARTGWLARELPQRWVGIVEPVAMGRYPVTVGEWRAFVQATGWRQSGEVNWEAPGFPQTELHPVVGINWYDAQQYLGWLGETTGRRYRLPSEAEWEYACRAGTKTAFHFGDTISTAQANYDGNFSYNGSAPGEFRRGTTPAGTFPPNPWGLCDMHGNVWEWVQDVVHDNYEGAPLDGSAWEEGGDQARRILRGGAWLYKPCYLRSALRNGFSSALSSDIVGFRVVRER